MSVSFSSSNPYKTKDSVCGILCITVIIHICALRTTSSQRAGVFCKQNNRDFPKGSVFLSLVFSFTLAEVITGGKNVKAHLKWWNSAAVRLWIKSDLVQNHLQNRLLLFAVHPNVASRYCLNIPECHKLRRVGNVQVISNIGISLLRRKSNCFWR